MGKYGFGTVAREPLAAPLVPDSPGLMITPPPAAVVCEELSLELVVVVVVTEEAKMNDCVDVVLVTPTPPIKLVPVVVVVTAVVDVSVTLPVHAAPTGQQATLPK